MASACCQYYDTDSNTERAEIVLNVPTRPNVDKSHFIFFVIIVIVPINSDGVRQSSVHGG